MVSGYAALPAVEGEDVWAWIRRQNNPVKPGVPKAAPKKDSAVLDALADAVQEKAASSRGNSADGTTRD